MKAIFDLPDQLLLLHHELEWNALPLMQFSRVWFAIAKSTLFYIFIFLHQLLYFLFYSAGEKTPIVILLDRSQFTFLTVNNTMRRAVTINWHFLDWTLPDTVCKCVLETKKYTVLKNIYEKIVISCFMISSEEIFFSHWPNSSWCIFLACKDKLNVQIATTEVKGHSLVILHGALFCSGFMVFVQGSCFCLGSYTVKSLIH